MVNPKKPNRLPRQSETNEYTDKEQEFMAKADEGDVTSSTPKKRGRPKEEPKEVVLCSVPLSLIAKIDELRAGTGVRRPTFMVSLIAAYVQSQEQNKF